MKKIYLFVFPIISAITSILVYSALPDIVPSHWNYLGQVDGYSTKLTISLLFPGLQLFLLSLLFFIPKLDPMYKSIEKFEDEFHKFIGAFLIFFLLVQYQVILWTQGTEISPNVLFPILMGLLFFQTGTLLKKSKRNWTIGIRTPWTLLSDGVWEKTHNVGANLFKIALPISITSLFFEKYSLFIILGYILFSVIYVFIYSYKEYNKEKKGQRPS